MGGKEENGLYLFAGNTHAQICTLALAMDKAKSTDSLIYTNEIPAVDNPPGEEIDDILVALKKVREGVKINFQGAGSICDFDARGDQLNRHYGHFCVEKGRQVLVQIIKGPNGVIPGVPRLFARNLSGFDPPLRAALRARDRVF